MPSLAVPATYNQTLTISYLITAFSPAEARRHVSTRPEFIRYVRMPLRPDVLSLTCRVFVACLKPAPGEGLYARDAVPLLAGDFANTWKITMDLLHSSLALRFTPLVTHTACTSTPTSNLL